MALLQQTDCFNMTFKGSEKPRRYQKEGHNVLKVPDTAWKGLLKRVSAHYKIKDVSFCMFFEFLGKSTFF